MKHELSSDSDTGNTKRQDAFREQRSNCRQSVEPPTERALARILEARFTAGLEPLVLTVSEDNRNSTDMINETWCNAVMDE